MRLRFVKTSFFPGISLNDILRMAYDLGRNFHCSPFTFDHVDYFEFVWQYEKLRDELDSESQKGNTNTNLMDQLGSMR